MSDEIQRPQYQLRISDLPRSERPRERLLREGARALSSAELLAIILRTGVRGQNVLQIAQSLLGKYDGLRGLAAASPDELAKEHSLGPAKVAQLQAALELGRRLLVSSPDDRPQVRSPEDVYTLLMDMGNLSQEELRTLLLDSKNRVIRIRTIYVGSVNASVFRTGELFREAVRSSCASIIVAHNHPSGDPSPSPEDVAVTRQIVEAGKLLNIDVLDHLIIGQRRYVSLKERGLGFQT